jgi:hypothetical protein
MSPSEMAELRALMRSQSLQTSKQIGALHKKIDPVAKSVAKLEQWMDDKSCERHEGIILENQKEITGLKVANVAQDGNVKLKFGVMQFFAMVVASLVTMVPVAIALISYVNKLAIKHGGP